MNEIGIPSFTLGQLGQLTGGQVCGDPELNLSGFSSDPLKANSKELCFVFTNKYLKLLNEGKLNAGAYLVPSNSNILKEVPRVLVERPKLVIKQLLELFAPKRFSYPIGVHKTAIVDPTSKIGENVKIGPNVIIGPGCSIGNNTELQAGVILGQRVSIGSDSLIKYRVVIEDSCKIGHKVIIHPGSIVGADGFSYVTEDESNLEKVRKGTKPEELQAKRQIQLKVLSAGWVEIDDEVEIGANSCIDRGTLGPTRIGKGSKIDNQVQIAHNCQIGEDCLMVGQSGLAGSVILGDRCIVAGHSGCKDNIEVPHDTIIAPASHVHKAGKPFQILGGDPAIPADEYVKREKSLRRAMREAPKLREELDELKKTVQNSTTK
ncbi:MAG: UDP-3-O-(3-hydroxymyristoyl)glucosamine N-acyltransferase [Candidatus Caenarcaniphilales bacterium]|nr:UDP-3-O-(3-hydroxymyristoyl)glucosamine N-acyltransferase [Candidatus Caenarcaniphilales bacterium]